MKTILLLLVISGTPAEPTDWLLIGEYNSMHECKMAIHQLKTHARGSEEYVCVED